MRRGGGGGGGDGGGVAMRLEARSSGRGFGPKAQTERWGSVSTNVMWGGGGLRFDGGGPHVAGYGGLVVVVVVVG